MAELSLLQAGKGPVIDTEATGPDGSPPGLGKERRRKPPQAWRSGCAVEAAYEIAAIGTLLQREFAGQDPEMDPTLVRSLGTRLEELGNIVMSCDDEDDTEAGVAARLFGPEADRARRRREEERHG